MNEETKVERDVRIYREAMSSYDKVNHPKHYTAHPSGVECITIAEHMGFNLGNTLKYIWRADFKNDAIEDLKKAAWYLNREIQKRTTQDASKKYRPPTSSALDELNASLTSEERADLAKYHQQQFGGY